MGMIQPLKRAAFRYGDKVNNAAEYRWSSSATGMFWVLSLIADGF